LIAQPEKSSILNDMIEDVANKKKAVPWSKNKYFSCIFNATSDIETVSRYIFNPNSL